MANNLGKILLVALSSLGASVILGTQLLKPAIAESPLYSLEMLPPLAL